MSKPKKQAPKKRTPKAAAAQQARRAEAYLRMEPLLCDCERVGRLADLLSVDHDRDLYNFAVELLADMLKKLRAGYYAESFPQ
jgi:hypothetical protein